VDNWRKKGISWGKPCIGLWITLAGAVDNAVSWENRGEIGKK